MRSRNQMVLASFVCLLVGSLLAGCDAASSLRIGWRELGGRNRTRAQYVTFDGRQAKSFRVEAGPTIEIHSEVVVDKGSLAVQLISPDGEVVWDETFREDRQAFTTVTASTDGRHIVRVEGDETGGSFDVSWSVKDQSSRVSGDSLGPLT